MPDSITVAELDAEGMLLWTCPGCGNTHGVPLDRWRWNGSTTKPTLTPSVVVPIEGHRCHCWIRDGQIHYLDDCDHELAGQIVPMEDFDA